MKMINKTYFSYIFVGSLFLGVLLLAACGSSPGSSSSNPTPTPLPTPIVPEKPIYEVQHGTVMKTLEFIGRVSPVLEEELFFKSDGFIGEVFFGRGDDVQEGDLLAELAISDLQNRLAQQEIALQTSEVNLAKAKQLVDDQLLEAAINLEKLQLQLEQDEASNTSSRFVSSQVNLQAANRELADAQDAYDIAWEPARDWELNFHEPSCLPGQGGGIPCTGQPLKERLENERVATEQRVIRAQDNLTIARADYNDTVTTQDADGYSSQILELDIVLAENRIETLDRGVDPLLSLDVERASLEIQDTERQISEARLVAPFSGQLLSAAIRPGDLASAFKTVIVLADLGQLEITAELGGDDLAEMSVGQPATIQLRGRPDSDFAGTVRQLPYPYGGGTVETEEDDTAVRIALSEADLDLEMGELATVIIFLEEKPGALWLPPEALRAFQGRTFVVIRDEDGTQRRVDVRTGIESDDRVEILEGLEEGQIVIGQ
jgi:multidrug efflux pump subunit AcrA (membrane-fusion protein)